MESRWSERFGRLESQFTSRQQADERARDDQANATAEQFFDELQAMKPEEAPEARYVEQVLPRFQSMVAAELKAGQPLDVEGLKTIYRDAAWSLPDVRDAMQNDIAARQKAAEKTVTRTVRRVSSSASGSPGTSAHSDDMPEKMTVRESVQRAIAEEERRLSGSTLR